jgi:hypothetical protein
MYSSNDSFREDDKAWGEGYFHGVSAVHVNRGIMFEQVAAYGHTFQAAAFLNATGWLEFAHRANFYCFGFTYGMYDSASRMLKTEIVDVFDAAAYEEYGMLSRMAAILDKTILADFKMFYNSSRKGDNDG